MRRTPHYTVDDVRALLMQRAEQAGSQRAAASAIGISPAYFSDIVRGKEEPSVAVAAALGLQRVTVYFPNGGPTR